MNELLAIARPAVAQHGLSIAVVKQALQDAHTPCGSARLTELMQHLRREQAHTAPQPEPARAQPSDA
jgi:hypothetical protein